MPPEREKTILGRFRAHHLAPALCLASGKDGLQHCWTVPFESLEKRQSHRAMLKMDSGRKVC